MHSNAGSGHLAHGGQGGHFSCLGQEAAAGQAGVERALEKYKSELIRDMKLMGCTKISDLNRSNLRFRTY